MAQKQCTICGNNFEAIRNKKTCSDNCSLLLRRSSINRGTRKRRLVKENREKDYEYSKRWVNNNRDKVKEIGRRSRVKNCKKIKEKRDRNAKEYYLKYSKPYVEKNRKILNQKRRLKMKEKRKNLDFRLKEVMSNYVRYSLKNKCGLKKNFKGLCMFDYTIEDFILNIESKFQEEMSWDNYGREGWHIDHIKPIASFKFINDDGSQNLEQIKDCWNLDNLQPLWAKDNISKSSWYNGKKYRGDNTCV